MAGSECTPIMKSAEENLSNVLVTQNVKIQLFGITLLTCNTMTDRPHHTLYHIGLEHVRFLFTIDTVFLETPAEFNKKGELQGAHRLRIGHESAAT